MAGRDSCPTSARSLGKDYIENLPDEYLAAVITEGGAYVGKSAFMPSWKSTLSEQDIADVIAFIRTLLVE